MEQLLSTKFYIPPTRPKLVSRPRLVERINHGLHRKLTLISAPAGFGKTTLVSEWVDKSPADGQDKFSIAWLSLDENDNDLVHFFSYVITAFRKVEAIDENFGGYALGTFQSPQPPPTEIILTSLINDLTAFPDKIILILDDYHLISNSVIDDALTFLLEHLPPQLHLILITRVDPQLPLARLRAGSQLNELRATDLRFTSSEATEFLNQVMELDLSKEDITALENRTEGWIAGLQLAAISIQGYKDTNQIIQSFTGSHRLVLDYLIEEVIDKQSESVQNFLLQTAILDQLTGSLCNALTGQENSQQILADLEHTNLFIVPLDEERRWYRYHHLFAELLKQRLKLAHPDMINELHTRAQLWYEAEGNLPEAIRHALARNEFNTAARLIETGALEALESSQIRFILHWVDQLPVSAVESFPWLFIYHCWALVLSGQVDAAAPKLEDTSWLLTSMSEEQSEKVMLGYIAGAKAFLARWRKDYSLALDFVKQALKNLPENNWIRGYCSAFLGSNYWEHGNLQAAIQAYSESFSLGRASKNIMVTVSAAGNIARLEELQGRLHQSVKTLKESFHLAEQSGYKLPVAGYIHIDLGRLLYELNELDASIKELNEGIKLCKQLGDGRAEKIGYCHLARVQIARGKFTEARDSIHKAEIATPSPSISFDLRGGEYPHIRLWLKEKKLQKLKAWIHESDINLDRIPQVRKKFTFTMHPRVLIALGRESSDSIYLTDALNLLTELSELAEKHGWRYKAIEIQVLMAMALQAQGDFDQAILFLKKALTLAKTEGYIRTFVDEGPPMAKLLYEAFDRDIAPDYVNGLLKVFTEFEPEQPTLAKTLDPNDKLIEPLTDRECEVLRLIAEGLTNQEVASKLFLSMNTIKVHTRNIFGKLNVSNRTQAVIKAKSLGILPSE